MRTRNMLLVLGLCAVAVVGFFVGQRALAEEQIQVHLGLEIMSPTLVMGETAVLMVEVSPEALGGYGHLTATIDDQPVLVQTFDINEPLFELEVSLPSAPEFVDKELAFQYEAWDVGDESLGLSKKPGGYLEPEFD